jgi:3',5'-cyclic AMP phosphodiesterase CpdA
MHISDVHLGPDIVFRSILRRRAWWNFVDSRVTSGLCTAIRELSPEFIVLSGDLVNKPNARSFRLAAAYLRNLFLNSHFDLKERLLVVPGNHDVSFWPKRHPDDLKRLHRYREFLRDLFGESDIESRRQRFVRVEPERKVVFACLDSTLKNFTPLAEGEIGASQRAWLKRKLTKIGEQYGDFREYTRIAVLHHHCVPISGTTPSGERFMQLLDAGDVLKLLDDLGFHLILHGHKHVPHVYPRMRPDSSVLTVVGAGTATCAFLPEQQGHGNTFNLITVSPEANELALQVYRANQNGEFEPLTDPKAYPLLRMPALGYSAQAMRKIITIDADGTMHVDVIKQGLRIDQPGIKMHRLPLRVVAEASGAKIVEFRSRTEDATARLAARADAIIDGEWVLRVPLEHKSQPVTVAYSYTLQGGTAMSKADYTRMYMSGLAEESSSVAVMHPMESLRLEVAFPSQFAGNPNVRVEHLGAIVPIEQLRHKFKHDPYTNRSELEVKRPPLDHIFSICWSLPDSWPQARVDQNVA